MLEPCCESARAISWRNLSTSAYLSLSGGLLLLASRAAFADGLRLMSCSSLLIHFCDEAFFCGKGFLICCSIADRSQVLSRHNKTRSLSLIPAHCVKSGTTSAMRAG